MKIPLMIKDNGLVAQLDRAPDYGSGGLGFESLRGHNSACLASHKNGASGLSQLESVERVNPDLVSLNRGQYF